MIISFRQGIVQYEQTGFLTVTPTHVSLVVLTTPTVVTVSHGISNYLHIEQESVSQAWGPVTPGVDQWLYWDINTLNANRTFGITRLSPVTSPVAPSSPANDQHWFDSINRVMKVWTGNHWSEKLRVFACKLVNGTIPTSMSTQAPLFNGSQVGITETTSTGQIMFDTISNKPLKVGSRFITTEDILSVKTLSKSDIKVAATIIEAEAQQALSAYTVVMFSDFGKIVHAASSTVNDNIPRGIIQQDVVPNNTVSVVTEGTITSEFWDWEIAGINAPLYCDDTGALVTTQVYPDQLPTAYVIDRRTIVLANISTVQEAVDGGVTSLGGLTDVTLTSPQVNQTLVYNGSDWVNVTPTVAATNLDALTDVTVVAPVTDQYLKFNGSQWINSALPTPITSLAALTDVTVTTPTVSQALTFDGTEWVNGDLPTGMTQEFTAVADQVLFGPLSQPYIPGAGQLSVYINGIKQYPSSFTESSATTFTISSPSRLNDVILAEISEINPNLIPDLTHLTDLTDVVAPLPVDGDVLTYNGTEWVNGTLPPGVIKWNNTTGTLYGPSEVGGSYNIAFGSDALFSNTTGSSNVAVGTETLYSNTTGLNNIGIGYGTLWGNIGGMGNVAIGVGNLQTNTTGNKNVALGNQSLTSNETGHSNIAVGQLAAWQNRIGSNNIAIGENALQSDLAPVRHIAIGTDALKNTVTITFPATEMVAANEYMIESVGTTDFTLVGAPNNEPGTVFTATGPAIGDGTVVDEEFFGTVAIGYQALLNNTTTVDYDGTSNVAVGYRSLYTNTLGAANTAVGETSLYGNTTGVNNVAIGARSQTNNTIGYNNVSVGVSSLYYNTTGDRNTALGTSALTYNTTGVNNTAIGHNAGWSLTTGSNNVLIGGYMGVAGMDGNVVLSTGDGTVRLQHNGTNWTSATPMSMAGLILPSTTSTITLNGSVGTAGQVLTSAGPGATPTWSAISVPPQSITINTQAGNYTLQVSDAFNTLIRMTSSSANTVTIPNDTTADLPIGAAVLISQNGTGQTSIVAAGGVTIISPDSLNIGRRYGKITAIKVGANSWEIEGNLAP
jgi:hypothetical protein